MPSFDVVSEVDLQEVHNAVDQANRELSTRYDFRGITASFERLGSDIKLTAQADIQSKAGYSRVCTTNTRGRS